MIQTVTVVILLLIGAAVAETNFSILHSLISFGLPGMETVTLTYLNVLAVIGGVLLLVWLAGLADLETLRAQIRRRNALVRAMDLELARMKSAAYDQQQPTLADIKARLGAVVQEISGLRARVEAATDARSQRVG
jgi:hypothetical protein